MLAIINADIIMPDHIIPDGYVIVEKDVIKDYGTMEQIGDLEGYDVLDADKKKGSVIV